MSQSLRLTVLPGRFSVCRLAADSAVPVHLLSEPFCSITRTPDEISLVVPENKTEPEWQIENGWRMLKVAGPLDFGLTGILNQITRPLTLAGISIFAVSTYDTDYVMVKEVRLEQAVSALRAAGMQVDAQGEGI